MSRDDFRDPNLGPSDSCLESNGTGIRRDVSFVRTESPVQGGTDDVPTHGWRIRGQTLCER